MPALGHTKFTATVVWLGARPNDPVDPDGIRSVCASSLTLGFDGAQGEIHSGATRSSCVRVRHMHPEGTEIRNTRQLSVVSDEELAEIANTLSLDAIDPAWLGATIVVKGIPDFSHVPPSSRLLAENGTSLIIDMENHPCKWPGKEIEIEHAGRGQDFARAARGKRGVTASVERPGTLSRGDQLTLYVPAQPAWAKS